MTWLDTELAGCSTLDYLDGLSERGLDEVRQMRSECEIAETAVSFLRRMAQGRLDLIHAYLDRRTRTEINDMRAFVDDLPSIIAAGPPPKTRSCPLRRKPTSRCPSGGSCDGARRSPGRREDERARNRSDDDRAECHRRRSGGDGNAAYRSSDVLFTSRSTGSKRRS